MIPRSSTALAIGLLAAMVRAGQVGAQEAVIAEDIARFPQFSWEKDFS
ncbi:MAG: hypothetical protein KatS3mg081_1398 [Gemmatimonadales bacterium]|nr:MAG: hypothetical protein KatS3mg081_1398 [Gemmatimonadales bacterium]